MSTDDESKLEATEASALMDAITTPSPKKSVGKRRSLFLVLLISVLILVMGAGSFRVFQLSQELSTRLASLSQQSDLNQQQLSELQEKWTKAQQQLQVQETALQTQGQALQEWRSSLQNLAPSHKNNLILDAQSWVQLASEHLVLSSDVPQALRLLTQAEEEVNKIEDPQVLPLKKALAQDLTALKSLPWVNTSDLYLRLLALQGQLQKLPVLLVPVPANEKPSLATSSEQLSSWERGMEHAWTALHQLVRVYHLPSATTAPFIMPDQQPYLYQNLATTLNETMWAVLHLDPKVYHASLQQASQWIQQYFQQNAPLTQTVLSELQALQAVSMQPAKDLSLVSPKAFQDYLRTETKA